MTTIHVDHHAAVCEAFGAHGLRLAIDAAVLDEEDCLEVVTEFVTIAQVLEVKNMATKYKHAWSTLTVWSAQRSASSVAPPAAAPAPTPCGRSSSEKAALVAVSAFTRRVILKAKTKDKPPIPSAVISLEDVDEKRMSAALNRIHEIFQTGILHPEIHISHGC